MYVIFSNITLGLTVKSKNQLTYYSYAFYSQLSKEINIDRV